MRIFNTTILFLIFGFVFMASVDARAIDEQHSLDERINNIKNRVLELNSDIADLEESLLFPESTQISVMVSSDDASEFVLSSVQLSIDDVPVSSYLYTQTEIGTLRKGGVQRFYIGNIVKGKHQIVATILGKVNGSKENRYIETTLIDKEIGPKLIELKIKNSQTPDFSFQIHK